VNILKRILQNSLWLSGTHLLGRLFGVVVTMALTRYLGIEDFGRFSLIFAFCGIFGVMTDIGMDMIIVREASRDIHKAPNLLGNGILIKAVFSVVAVGSAGATAAALGYPWESVGLIVLASLSFLASPLTLYNAMFQVVLRLKYPALFDLAGRTLTLLLVLLVLRFHGSLAQIVLAVLGAALGQAGITWFFARAFFRPSFRIDFSLCKRLISEAWPLAVNNLLLALILRVDQLMIERLVHDGDFQLGIYSAAVKYCELFHFLPAVYFASVFPLLSRLHAQGDDRFRRLSTLSMKYLTMAIMPVALYSTLHAGRIMGLLFGEAFSVGALPMVILIWSEVSVFMVWVVFNTVISSGHQRIVPALTSTALAANVLLNLWLIPGHGAAGAAAASLVSYSLALFLVAAVPPLRSLARAFVLSAARPAGAVLLLWILLVHVPMRLIPSGLVLFPGFLALMIVSGALGRSDLDSVRGAFSSERTGEERGGSGSAG